MRLRYHLLEAHSFNGPSIGVYVVGQDVDGVPDSENESEGDVHYPSMSRVNEK